MKIEASNARRMLRNGLRKSRKELQLHGEFWAKAYSMAKPAGSCGALACRLLYVPQRFALMKTLAERVREPRNRARSGRIPGMELVMHTMAVNPIGNAMMPVYGEQFQTPKKPHVALHDADRMGQPGRQGSRDKADVRVCLEQGLLGRALEGDAGAMRALIGALHPIIRARAVRRLLRCKRIRMNGSLGQEVDDLVQDVWARLFASGAKELRRWAPERGLGLVGYVGLVAERYVISILRSRRQNPCTNESGDDEQILEGSAATPSPERACASREILLRVVNALRAELSGKGAVMFELLIVEEQPLEHVCIVMDMSRDAAYAWRSRIARRARMLLAELSCEPCG